MLKRPCLIYLNFKHTLKETNKNICITIQQSNKESLTYKVFYKKLRIWEGNHLLYLNQKLQNDWHWRYNYYGWKKISRNDSFFLLILLHAWRDVILIRAIGRFGYTENTFNREKPHSDIRKFWNKEQRWLIFWRIDWFLVRKSIINVV